MRAIFLLAAAACHPVASPPSPAPQAATQPGTELLVRAQTEDEAFEFLWSQLRQMPFYRANGYDVSLPEHPFFRRLADGPLREADRSDAERLFKAEVYKPRDFDAGLRIFEETRPRLAPALVKFDTWTRTWGFEHRPRVEIILTLYGPGGSYDPDASTITVLTTDAGMLRKPPLENLVHEMVHLGIERPIVRRFGLTHPEKERLVDRICVVAFRNLLPDYHPQPMGPADLDAVIDEEALRNLPETMARYVSTHVRPSPVQ